MKGLGRGSKCAIRPQAKLKRRARVARRMSPWRGLALAVPVSVAALAAAMPAPAAAQSDCPQSDPCLWAVTVDAGGFVGESSWNLTQADWMDLDVSNQDSVAHTVTFAIDGVTLTIPPGGEADKVIQAPKAGNYPLTDQPTGTQGTVTVFAPGSGTATTSGGGASGGPSGAAGGTNGGGNGNGNLGTTTAKQPALGIPALVAALAGLAVLSRRTR